MAEAWRRFAIEARKLPPAGTVWRYARDYGVAVRREWTADRARAYRQRHAWTPPHRLVAPRGGDEGEADDLRRAAGAAALDILLPRPSPRRGNVRDANV